MPTLRKHKPKPQQNITAERKRKERYKIYHSQKWQLLRTAKLMQNPLCEICANNGIITPAEHVHHIDSFMHYSGDKRLEKAFNFMNLQSICASCHAKEHNNF